MALVIEKTCREINLKWRNIKKKPYRGSEEGKNIDERELIKGYQLKPRKFSLSVMKPWNYNRALMI